MIREALSWTGSPMLQSRTIFHISLFLLATSGALSCGPNPARSPRSPSFSDPDKVSAQDAASGERLPAPVVKAPMAGEPAESALAEARLSSMACDDLG